MKIEFDEIGAEWKRGEKLGSGSFASVYLATSAAATILPPVMAVKSAETSDSCGWRSLAKEAAILETLQNYGGGCPYVIHYYGADYTEEPSSQLNVLLEYASLGSLGDKIRRPGKIAEAEVNHHTGCILKGLQFIHSNGYAHCDIKPDNILLAPSSSTSGVVPKVADFGHAKRVGKSVNKERHGLKGSPFYIAPESVSSNNYEPHSDVWALGCLVLEMLTGGKPWICDPKNTSLDSLLHRIGYTEELPLIPDTISLQARNFLKKCLARDPTSRWTIQMLLRHAFVMGEAEEDISKYEQVEIMSDVPKSPRGPLDSLPSFLSLDSRLLDLASSALDEDEENNEIHVNKRRKIDYQVKEEGGCSSFIML